MIELEFHITVRSSSRPDGVGYLLNDVELLLQA
jgi:hypothetical protein